MTLVLETCAGELPYVHANKSEKLTRSKFTLGAAIVKPFKENIPSLLEPKGGLQTS